jgi:hypothetical protein
MFLPVPLSQIVSCSPKSLLFFLLNLLRSNVIHFCHLRYLFFACPLPFVSSHLCSLLCFFSGSHFLYPSTFFFVLFQFALSPFSLFHTPPATKKPLHSLFFRSISTVPPLLIFSYISLLLLFLPFFFFRDGS